MGTRAGIERIEEITYAEAMRRFGLAMRAEGLPTKPVKNARWFASEVSCAALVRVSGHLARLKGAVTLPEWRGMGYGSALVQHRLTAAREEGFSEVEVFTRYPDWYGRQGFHVVRVARWGTVVMRMAL